MNISIYLDPPHHEPFSVFHLRVGDATLWAGRKQICSLKWRQWNEVVLPDGTADARISRGAYQWIADEAFALQDGLRLVYHASHISDWVEVVDENWQPGSGR